MAYLETPDILFQYAQMIMVTMPNPRMDSYESNDYKVIKATVLGYIDKIIEDIGLFPVTS